MATSSPGKRKKFSLSTLFSILLAVLPEVLTALNDPHSSDTVYLEIAGNSNTGNVKISQVQVEH